MADLQERPLALVVDDDPIFRSATVAALTKIGLRTREAGDGEAALRSFVESPADVVLLDAQMPILDGFGACECLRALPGGEVVPVLMLTALDDEESIRRAWEAGATDFCSKPPRWSVLGHRVRFMVRAARMREDLEKSRVQSARAERIAHLGHWEWDIAAGRVAVSEECARLIGLTPQTATLDARDFLACFHAGDRALLAELGQAAAAPAADDGPYVLECRIPQRPAPRLARVEATLVRAADGHVSHVNAVMQDVTERRMAEERIRNLAAFDPLTGLANRGRFREQVAEAIDASVGNHTGAVIVVDLRRLARVNEVLGDRAGDRLLREAAARLAAGLGAVLERFPGVRGAVGRPAGHEFAILLTGAVDATAAASVGERIVEQLRPPFDLDGREIIVCTNAGFALFPEDAGDVDELLKRADHGLLAAKAGRPGAVARCPEAAAGRSDTLALETALHHALERREMVLHYQPQIDVRDGRVVGAEALLRWRRPDGLLLPAAFLPLAAETGLIEPIEEWAILAACWQYRLWREAGLDPVPVAVNLTASHFVSPSLVGTVSTALAESGCPPGHLELEITESVLLHDLALVLPQIEALKALGVHIAIDDFGTGYSSLAYLRSLPIDRLKIDRSFVSDLGESRDARSLVAAMLTMARGLGLKVVAEGVETREQAERLAQYGCPVMQGFWFACPMPAADLQALVSGPHQEDWRVARSAERTARRDAHAA